MIWLMYSKNYRLSFESFSMFCTFLITILLFTGCAKNNLSKPHKSFVPETFNTQSISETILLLADNQITEERNKPIIENSSHLARTSVGRSVYRHGAATVLSPAIIQHIISENDGKLVIHLGDALNNSCVSEYNLFEKTMGDSIWFHTPGNHDGYYMGLTTPISEKYFLSFGILNEPEGWCQICRPYYHYRQHDCIDCERLVKEGEQGKFIINKRQFIKRYLKSIGLSSYEQSLSYDKAKDTISGARYKYLTKAKWFLSEKEEQPWDSFIVQQLFAYTKSNKEAFAIIILDTACYSKKPKLRSHAGAADTGEIIEKQKEIVSEWLISLKERGLPVILIGHHPLDDFTQASIKAIRKWYNSNLFVSYISADVHDSYDVLHTKIKNKDDKPLKEFNFGSTIDAPIEYGFLTMKENYNFETLRNFMTPFKNKHGKLDNLWINCTCSFGLFDHEMGKKIYLGDQASKLDKIINEVQAGKITNELKTSLHSLTKLRRYSEMFYVYRLIFEKSTHEKKDIILKHIDEAITILDKQKGSNGCVPRLIQLSYYLDGKKCRYFYEKIDGKSEEKWDFDIENNGLKNLQEMVLEIMNSPETTEELKKLIVCSALFAAEFDYPTKK